MSAARPSVADCPCSRRPARRIVTRAPPPGSHRRSGRRRTPRPSAARCPARARSSRRRSRRARAARRSANPGPSSATTTTPPPSRRRLHGRRVSPTPSGVCAMTLPSSASSAASRSAAVVRTSSSRCGGRCQRDRPALVLGQRAPERDPLRRPPPERRSARRRRRAPARRASSDQRVDLAGELVDVGTEPVAFAPGGSRPASRRSAVIGVRSRCERSATDFPFGRQQLPDPRGQPVERGPDLAHLVRTVRRRPAPSISPWPSRSAAPASSVIGQVIDRARRSATTRDSSDQHQPEQPEDEPGAVHALAQQRPGTRSRRPRCARRRRPAGAAGRRRRSVRVTVVGGAPTRRRPPRRRVTRRPDRRRSWIAVEVGHAPRRSACPRSTARRQRPGSAASRRRRRCSPPTRLDEHGEGHEEGEQHDRRRRRHQQREPAPHQPGTTSFTPTPRTLCSICGSAAVSPELAPQPGQVDVDGLVRAAVRRAARPRRAASAWRRPRPGRAAR